MGILRRNRWRQRFSISVDQQKEMVTYLFSKSETPNGTARTGESKHKKQNKKKLRILMDFGFFARPFRRNSQKSLQWSGPCACLALLKAIVGPCWTKGGRTQGIGKNKPLPSSKKCLSCLDFTRAIQIQGKTAYKPCRTRWLSLGKEGIAFPTLQISRVVVRKSIPCLRTGLWCAHQFESSQ